MKSSILSTLLLIAFSFSSNLSQAQDSSLSSSDSSLLQDSLVGYVYSTSCYKPTNGRIIQHITNLPSGISTLPSSLRNGMYLIKFVTPTTQFVKRAIIY